ncbi:MAG: hypothetical protein MUO85_03195 [candidate division Zixibacteria bacterium]|nr:hypothetical protein [candidate division Zixibacteria bacterium]
MIEGNNLILGINSFTHDTSIALISSQNPLWLLEEERFSRIKHHEGLVYYGSPPYRTIARLKDYIHDKIISRIAHVGAIDYSAASFNLPQRRYIEFAESLDPNLEKTVFLSHHKCHAASTFFCSGFDRALICVIDSRGDGISISFSKGVGNSIEGIREIGYGSSIASIYTYISELIGLGRRSEGKLMGLAAYGENDKLLTGIFEWNGHYISINRNILDKAKINDDMPFEKKADVALSIQTEVENVILEAIDTVNAQVKEENLALAGGFFLNCRLVGRIRQRMRFKDIFVQPAANDAGTALGAALLCLEERRGFNFDSVLYGTEYSQEYVRSMLNKYDLEYQEAEAEEVAKELCENRTVGVFSGRMEFGPRALGSRSIFANPSDVKIVDRLNKIIKNREPWRPYAPSVLDEYGDFFFENYKYSPYMTESFLAKDKCTKEAPAIVHRDNSSRLQSVRRDGSVIRRILEEFYAISGIPMVLNTSFNKDAEPIIESPDQAIADFYASGLDCLYIEGVLLRKRKK